MKDKIFTSYKLLNSFDKVERVVSNRQIIPTSFGIGISNQCNHNCIWCIDRELRTANPINIKLKLAFSVIDQLDKFGVKTIIFSGSGEPLCHMDFIEILTKVKSSNLKAGLITNGGFLNKDIANAIMDSCEFIRFSIDAGKEKTYKRVHRSGNPLESILGWIRYFNNEKPDNFVIGTSFLMHKLNHGEVVSASKIFKDAGASYVQVRIEHDKAKKLPLNFSKCRIQNFTGAITADGKVYPCCHMRGNSSLCLGDLNKQSFKDIWLGDRRKEVISKLNIEECPSYCRYAGYNEMLEYLSEERLHCDFL